MRIFSVQNGNVAESSDLAAVTPPEQGYVWVACSRSEFESTLTVIQATLQALGAQQLVDLHISDLLNSQLPSHYDYRSGLRFLIVFCSPCTQTTALCATPTPPNCCKPHMPTPGSLAFDCRPAQQT